MKRRSVPLDVRLTDLIRRARTAVVGLTMTEAAERALISEPRWRQIESRQRPTAPVATTARMARAVGLSPEQVADAGHPDVAEELRELNAILADDEPTPADERESERPQLQAIEGERDDDLARAEALLAEAQQLLRDLRRERGA